MPPSWKESTGRSNFNAWHETHNTFTQVSCEDGLPGLIFYCLALLYCYTSVRSVEKLARKNSRRAAAEAEPNRLSGSPRGNVDKTRAR